MFRGRPIVEETTVVYDGTGSVSGTRTVRQSEWLGTDRLLALGLDMHERSLCDGCGHPKARAWDPAMASRFAGADVECHACTAAQDWMQQQREWKPNDRRALKFYVVDQGPDELPPGAAVR